MSMPLRVLHLHSGNMFGGIETIMVTLARQQGGELSHTFALCFSGRLSEELLEHGSPVHLLPGVRVSRPWTVRRARARLREALDRVRPDVAMCHSAWSRVVFGPALEKSGQRCVLWQHSAPNREHWLDRFSRRASVDIVICNSRFTETLQLVREPSARTAVVHPPVPPPDRTVDRSTARRELRRELGVPEATTIVLQVGRIERGKGHTAHLEAAASLSDLPDWLIVQVGGVQTPAERRYQTELDRLVSRLGLKDRVRFVGERTDCSRFYAGADVYCQPATLPESFGITLVEALHAGLPVITSDIGASREIVNDECGVLVPGGDVRALAAALRGLVGDTATRECLGRNGPERAAALCDPQFCVTRLHEILSAVAA